jgi:hypothetical protein
LFRLPQAELKIVSIFILFISMSSVFKFLHMGLTLPARSMEHVPVTYG